MTQTGMQLLQGIPFIPVPLVPGTLGTNPVFHTETKGPQRVGANQLGQKIEFNDIWDSLPDALEDVTLTIEGYGDFDAADEFLSMELNEVASGTVFSGDEGNTGNVFSQEEIIISAATWNALKAAPVSPDPVDSIRINLSPELTVSAFPQIEDPAMECPDWEGIFTCGVRIRVRYKKVLGTDFVHSTGPTHWRWRSRYKVISHDSVSEPDYLWAVMKWNLERASWALELIDGQPLDVVHRNGFGTGSEQDPANNEEDATLTTNLVTRAMVPLELDTNLIRFTAQPDCILR